MVTLVRGGGERSMDVQELFLSVASLVSEAPEADAAEVGETVLDEPVQLRLYGLYKRVTVGPLSEVPRGNPKPSIFAVVQRAKYEAWASCDSLTADEARWTYVELVASLPNTTGRQAHILLQETTRRHNNAISATPASPNPNNDALSVLDDHTTSPMIPVTEDTKNARSTVTTTNTTLLPSVAHDNDNDDSSRTRPPFLSSHTTSAVSQRTTRQEVVTSFLTNYLNIQPLIPRGQLDISFRDLGFALWQCIRPTHWSHMRLTSHYEQEIASLWQSGLTSNDDDKSNQNDVEHHNIVTGLSVRSLFDLFLLSKSYPKGSEIIVVPPINIQGMIDIMHFHDIKVVPVDIIAPSDGGYSIGVDLKAVKARITDRTVAIMVVHVFGMVTTLDQQMLDIRKLSDQFGLDVIEDCAECYSGLSSSSSSVQSYCGNPNADISFFSFGTIKTSTALGGGVAIVRNSNNNDSGPPVSSCGKTRKHWKPASMMADDMNRLQYSLFGQQSNREYLWKVLKAIAIRCVAHSPLLCGISYLFITCLGFDFDDIITSAIRGFAGKKNPNDSSITDSDEIQERRRLRAFIEKIRKRPSSSLLSVLARRLSHSTETCQTVELRIRRCQRMIQLIKKHAPQVTVPRCTEETATHLYWLLPITVHKPSQVSHRLLKAGFDVPPGTSQLSCITKYCERSTEDECKHGGDLMKNILYLPTASLEMSDRDMQRLVFALAQATTTNLGPSSTTTSRKTKLSVLFSRNTFLITGVVLLSICASIYAFGGNSSHLLWLLQTMVLVVFTAIRVYLAFYISWCVVLYLLRLSSSGVYLGTNKAFAKYYYELRRARCSEEDTIITKKSSSASTPLDKTEKTTDETMVSRGIVDMIPCLQLASTCDNVSRDNSEDGKASNIIKDSTCPDMNGNMALLTGATGFIGSLLLRDLLLHRIALSLEGGVVIICRPKRRVSAAHRIKKLLSNPMYDFLSDEEKACLVTVVEGDVTQPDVGMSNNDKERVCNKFVISHVFHCAAAVKFTQSLDDAAVSNITSSLQMQALTKMLKMKKAKYIHISTAFVHGDRVGTASDPIEESLYSLHPYNAEEIYRSMRETQSYASSAMLDLGFPNTYTFSKCVCEHLLHRDTSVDTIIIRPSIVGPAVQEPYEGWAGDKPSTIVAAACLYYTLPCVIWCYGSVSPPVVPVDVVSRFILVKAFAVDIPTDSSLETSPPSSQSSSDDDSDEFLKLSKGKVQGLVAKSKYTVIRHRKCVQIYNAVWDAKSPLSTSFNWKDYAVTLNQLGSTESLLTRPTAFFVLLLTVEILPRMNLDVSTFQQLHNILVHLPYRALKSSFRMFGWTPTFMKQLEKLSQHFDLPVLFFPFMNNQFHFQSELVAPSQFCGERYMVSCAIAAGNFVTSIKAARSRKEDQSVSSGDSTETPLLGNTETRSGRSCSELVAGNRHVPCISDLWWAITQPQGNVYIRIIGWIMRKILRLTCTELTVDVASFAALSKCIESLKTELSQLKASQDHAGSIHVILAPTHRSFLDFIILSYICFAIPELGIAIPHIAAADDFSRVPILGWFAKGALAFFLKRGRGVADPELSNKLVKLKQSSRPESPVCIEVFIEGRRSRDRRFVCPKTGFLRCLSNTGGSHIVLPISISYERLAEQATLTGEACGARRSTLDLTHLFFWLKKVYRGDVRIGRVHVAAAPGINMPSFRDSDFMDITKNIQRCQKSLVCVSEFHIMAGAAILGINPACIRKSLEHLGCSFWPNTNEGSMNGLELPVSTDELWSIALQYGSWFAPFLRHSRSFWSEWMDPTLCEKEACADTLDSKELHIVVSAFQRVFDTVDDAVDANIQILQKQGFSHLNHEHVLQLLLDSGNILPNILVKASLSRKLHAKQSLLGDSLPSALLGGAIGTDAMKSASKLRRLRPTNEKRGEESFGAWGYTDSGFIVSFGQGGSKCVTMKGSRYSISGQKLPGLIPFLERETEVSIDLMRTALPVLIDDPTIEKGRLTRDQISKLEVALGSRSSCLSVAAADRIRHGTGHSQEDMFIIRSGRFQELRFPDAVIWPTSEQEVQNLISVAVFENLCLIPFGGGTSVTHSVHCPSRDIEPRAIVSVDMKLIDNILWVNEEDGLAHVQAGITGADLVRQLESRGFTMGHEPDSLEFSTLGGWIATKASGMKRNKYGNIEDIVKDVRVAGPRGMIWQKQGNDKSAFGRTSTGLDLQSLMMGSEGCLGIITSAVIRICPTPESKVYEGIIFPSFDAGVRFIREVAKLGALIPASVRLVDNEQFRLGQVFRKESSGLEWVVEKIKKRVASIAYAFDPTKIVCVTLMFEGRKMEVNMQQKVISDLCATHGGVKTGEKIGRSGYDLTYAIAYLRDWAMTHHFTAESFETFIPWSKLQTLIHRVKERITKEHKQRFLPGRPLVSCRVTQLYKEGACVYFYYCMNFKSVSDPHKVFASIEVAARDEIMKAGGSLSHHHGVGKLRASFMNQVNSENFEHMIVSLKDGTDPENLFGARNGQFFEKEAK